ncbi:MAG: hypothetical protein V1904_07095 [Bacteroidota bacterium]
MQSILIPITNETDISFILGFFKRLGMKAMIIDEETRQMKARKSLIAVSRKTKKSDSSGKEILDEIKAYRKSKHAVK